MSSPHRRLVTCPSTMTVLPGLTRVAVTHRVEDEMCHSFTVLAGLSKEAHAACARLADDVALALAASSEG